MEAELKATCRVPGLPGSGAPSLAIGLKKLLSTLIPFGGVLSGSMAIAWATEVTAFFLSRGLAFALLALLQVLPEFAVEAVITIQAARDPSGLDLVTANFTGANRLLVGLFLPLVFFIYAWVADSDGEPVTSIELPQGTALEIVALVVPTLYSLVFALWSRITLADAAILTSMYVIYLVLAYRMPAGDEDEEEVPAIPRRILKQPSRLRTGIVGALFVGGGVILFASVEPFYHNTIGLAAALGVPAYFLFQWIAPLLSEAPELITVSYWARTGRAQLGITNLLSSKINQWTLLVAMIPVVYAAALFHLGKGIHALPLTDGQQVEILLTATQALFAAACLATLTFERWQAIALAVLWAIQAADPLIDPLLAGWLPSPFPAALASGALVREWFTVLYLVLAVWVLFHDRDRLILPKVLGRIWRRHLRPSR